MGGGCNEVEGGKKAGGVNGSWVNVGGAIWSAMVVKVRWQVLVEIACNEERRIRLKMRAETDEVINNFCT